VSAPAPDVDVLLRDARATRCRRLMLRGLLATPLATPMVAFIVAGEVETRRILIWVTLALTAFAAAAAIAVFQPRRRPNDPDAFIAPAGLIGVPWGLVGPVLRPDDTTMQAVMVVILVSVAAVSVVMCAPSTRSFVAMSGPLFAISTIWLATSTSGAITALAPLSFPLFAVFGLLHAEVKAAIGEALRTAIDNRLLAAELVDQSEHVVRANEALTEANTRLSHRAQHDSLTGLLNRHGLMEHIEAHVRAARPGQGLAVLYLDLDRFKLVNDALGHLAGDRLLQTVADRCRTQLPSASTMARLGGDEFCIVATNLTDEVDAYQLAERVRRTLDDPIAIDGRTITATTSIGVSYIEGSDDSAEDLLRFADAALYRAKDAGRNRVAFFDDAMRATINRRIDEGSELRNALDAGLIVPWFQPEVDLFTGRIVGAEGLARWLHPTRGVVVAGAFLPIAEEVGLDEAISHHVGVEIVRTRRAWESLGVPRDLRLRCNVTARQLEDEDAIAQMVERSLRNEIPWFGISVEVTETGIIRDVDHAVHTLAMLRTAGVTVALDDFGTGHSSLSLLQRLPLDTLKIDRSFVRDLVDDSRDRALVRAAITMATELGLSVTAEGVETEEQADILRSFGCERAQGFLYSPAVPEAEFLAMIGVGVSAT
jgi:diguanylate cyclase (GGDEF)-like protein